MIRAFASEWIASPQKLPDGVTVCAVGDVHGCLDHLVGMIDYLRSNIISPTQQTTLVLIGDFIDRGPASLATLAYVRALELPGVEIVSLLGNHDFFLRLIAGPEDIDAAFIEYWLDVGGETTFKELGFTHEDLYRVYLGDLRARIRDQLGAGIYAFLANLAAFHRVGDYIFVHAGIDPALAVDAHDLSDLVMMREPFLTGASWSHAFTVVHGHTIRGHEVLPHRIAIDTGAFRTGILSCAQLEGSQVRWISVTDEDDVGGIGVLKTAMDVTLTYGGPFSTAFE